MRADFFKDNYYCYYLLTYLFETLQVYKSNPFQTVDTCPRNWTIFEKQKSGQRSSLRLINGTDICANTSCCCSYFSLRPSRASNVFLLHMLFLVPQISSSSSEEFSTFEAALMFCYALCRMFVFSSTGMIMLPSFVSLTQFGSFATF